MKNTFAWFAILMASALQFSCKAQPSGSPYAPEAGTYKGGSTGVTTGYQYSYNVITGYSMQPSAQIQYMQSPMGDMVITSTGANKGNYSFAKMKNLAGTWKYDPEKDQLIFTGVLKESLNYYIARKGVYSMGFTIKANAGDKQGVSYGYSKKASKEFPKLTLPNGNLTGSLTIKQDFKTISVFDVQTGKIKSSFTGSGTATANKALTIASVGFTTDPHYYQIKIIKKDGGIKNLEPDYLRSLNWQFHEYKFGVLSSDETKIALTGKTFDSYANLDYKPGYFAIGIFDLNKGNKLGLLPVKYNAYIKSFFLPDNRLVYSPDRGGIAVSNNDYNSNTIIYKNNINAFALSRDGKTIAFSEGVFFYTIDIDGNNKQQIVCNGEPASVDKAENVTDMCWSPDGKYIGLSFKSIGKFKIVVMPVDGSNYRIIRDADGEDVAQSNPAISWH